MLETDNGAAELTLRAVALRRKNFLFEGSNSGGGPPAIYSLIGSAKLNVLDLEFYLSPYWRRIADHPTSQVQDLPWNIVS